MASEATGIDPTDYEGFKKRTRVRYSCTICREKKRKCNRGDPCDQCEKRGLTSSCVIVPYLLRGGPEMSSEHAALRHQTPQSAEMGALQAKLHRLTEELGQMRNREVDMPRNPISESSASSVNAMQPSSGTETPGLMGITEPTTAGPMVDRLRYVDAANWEAILNDITRLTTHFKARKCAIFDAEEPEDMSVGNAASKPSVPFLLSGAFPTANKTTLMALLPPKDTTNKLIKRFFEGKEPALCMFHVPTFWKELHKFWEDESQFSLTWLGLLFSMISHAAFFCLRADEPVPGDMGPAAYVADIYRRHCARCLALDNYTTPGKYKVETMMLYFGTEYLRLVDAQQGTAILLSIIVRLAMHSGMHRDPSHFQGMSVFEGEMRKRLWTIVTEIDVLVAFQFGLPSNVQSRYFDTGLPQNLHDRDFDEATVRLPPERPMTEIERTPVMYTIVKSRLVVVFSDIVSRMADRDSPDYGEVMRLDERLERAHEEIPPVLRDRSFTLSVEDTIDLIMQRLWIELMYLKARIVLHRRYFTLGRKDIRFAHSRFACINAATKILEIQFNINEEYKPGGRLSRERWFVSSLSTHDFLLADMMLCLELSHLLRPEGRNTIGIHIDKESLLSILQTSRDIWKSNQKDSAEATRAFKILSRMLTLSTGEHYETAPESASSNGRLGADMGIRPTYQLACHPVIPAYMPQQTMENTWVDQDGSARWGYGPTTSSSESILIPIKGVDSAMNLDWSGWDTKVQDPNVDTNDLPWLKTLTDPLHG
ncbi:fungal specific transcription factor domain-containing protein [Colletotrichum orchidophilum]|uniref:Fungal specific transcription factor domain-containing protein n=1 Tax=Colletotrichum orchidophilum TaxID=1209926 RepID=A0A1G4BAZ1_9PEZI|nr:fungal specific transcription factor domain-containing protein [Colletotrichum orchidophilum]OHE98505.1 fungal specific transcription factor domain-containing protein [Colletotrichum orchidophilum]